MTAIEQNNLRAALESRAADLLRTVRNRAGLQVESAADELDQILLRSDRELAAGRILRESKMLAEVRAAIERIDDGTYATCQRCGDDIPDKRLKAVPWTCYCLYCQVRIDEGDTPESTSLFLKAA